jgi:hypothetical protein
MPSSAPSDCTAGKGSGGALGDDRTRLGSGDAIAPVETCGPSPCAHHVRQNPCPHGPGSCEIHGIAQADTKVSIDTNVQCQWRRASAHIRCELQAFAGAAESNHSPLGMRQARGARSRSTSLHRSRLDGYCHWLDLPGIQKGVAR